MDGSGTPSISSTISRKTTGYEQELTTGDDAATAGVGADSARKLVLPSIMKFKVRSKEKRADGDISIKADKKRIKRPQLPFFVAYHRKEGNSGESTGLNMGLQLL